MSRDAWRGFVRVILPKTISPTVGIVAEKVDDAAQWLRTVTAGGKPFLVDFVVETGPTTLAWRLEEKMCVP